MICPSPGSTVSPLVASTEGNNELVGFVGNLIAVVVPNLNVFNVQSAVDIGNPIPFVYLAGAFNYLICFAIAVCGRSLAGTLRASARELKLAILRRRISRRLPTSVRPSRP